VTDYALFIIQIYNTGTVSVLVRRLSKRGPQDAFTFLTKVFMSGSFFLQLVICCPCQRSVPS